MMKRQENRPSSRPTVYYFLSTTHFIIRLPTYIAHIAQAPQTSFITKADQRVQFANVSFNNIQIKEKI